MTAAAFAAKYFGPTKYAEPFITGDKIADVAETDPTAPQSNNVINPENLATDECAKDFAALCHGFFVALKIVPGPVQPAWGDPEQALQRITTSGPRTANWLEVTGTNQFNAFVVVHEMIGPLVKMFGQTSAENAFNYCLSQIRVDLWNEPSPTE